MTEHWGVVTLPLAKPVILWVKMVASLAGYLHTVVSLPVARRTRITAVLPSFTLNLQGLKHV